MLSNQAPEELSINKESEQFLEQLIEQKLDQKLDQKICWIGTTDGFHSKPIDSTPK